VPNESLENGITEGIRLSYRYTSSCHICRRRRKVYVRCSTRGEKKAHVYAAKCTETLSPRTSSFTKLESDHVVHMARLKRTPPPLSERRCAVLCVRLNRSRHGRGFNAWPRCQFSGRLAPLDFRVCGSARNAFPQFL